jgi:hypothetical protein
MGMKVLILKVVREDSTSHSGFVWPTSGSVVPDKWDPSTECGNGLHGWLNGEGNYRHEFMAGKWVVFEAESEDVVSLSDKVKARVGTVVYHGDKVGAIAFLKASGVLNTNSNPGWCCFTDAQLRELAYRSANRAVKTHAPKALRARGREDLAVSLESLPDIVDHATAVGARKAAARCAADAADAADAAYYAAAADAASAAYAASSAYYAADAADAAADAADAAYYAADAADAAADAAYYAAAADAETRKIARAAENEACRLDKLQLLGLV